MEKFMTELEKLKTPGNEKVVGKLMEGVNLIADEYRRRKANEKAAKLEAEGFAKLDEHRKASGLSTKAFVEGVGKTIIESTQPEEVKSKMMNSLSRYARHLTEAAGVMGCIYSMEPVDEIGKEYIASNKIGDLLQKCVLPKSEHKYGDAATARKAGVDQVIQDNGTDIGGIMYKIGRKLIDNDHEKLILLAPVDDAVFKMPYVLHYADTPKAAMDSSNMDTKSFAECIGNAIINSDYTERDKSAMLEGFGHWIKDKATKLGREFNTKYRDMTYYDDPSVQAKFIDEVYKHILRQGRNKFSKQQTFEAQKASDTEITGCVNYFIDGPVSNEPTKVPYRIKLTPSDDKKKASAILTFTYQMPGQQAISHDYYLNPKVVSYRAAAQITNKLFGIEEKLRKMRMEQVYAEHAKLNH